MTCRNCSFAVVALALVAVICTARSASACTVTGFTVGNNLNTAVTVPGYASDGSFERYAGDQVYAHFEGQDDIEFASTTQSSYACVDARGTNKQLGTPGGDLAEVIAATMALFKLEQKRVTKPDIKQVFDAFFDRVVSTRRPLYFHTDDNRLRSLYVQMGKDGVLVNGQPPSVLPEIAPSDVAAREQWLKNLVKPEFQGCGHIRLMLTDTTTPLYSVKLSGAVVGSCAATAAAAGSVTETGERPDDCISAKEVAQEIIRLYFERWWPTPVLSPSRKKIKFQVDVGPLVGKAVASISPATTPPRCKGLAPLLKPNFAGSTLFVYHGDAVSEFRRSAARRMGLATKGAAGRWAAMWDDIAKLQLGATLSNLSPANTVGLFPVTVQVE